MVSVRKGSGRAALPEVGIQSPKREADVFRCSSSRTMDHEKDLMARNVDHSFRDHTNVDLSSSTVAADWNDSEVIGTCFYQEADIDADRIDDIRKTIFPAGITGVTFRRCNLDNVLVPAGNTVDSDCTRRLLQVQNDLEDWEIDEDTLVAIRPIDLNMFTERGFSTDPNDIPVTRQNAPRHKR